MPRDINFRYMTTVREPAIGYAFNLPKWVDKKDLPDFGTIDTEFYAADSGIILRQSRYDDIVGMNPDGQIVGKFEVFEATKSYLSAEYYIGARVRQLIEEYIKAYYPEPEPEPEPYPEADAEADADAEAAHVASSL